MAELRIKNKPSCIAPTLTSVIQLTNDKVTYTWNQVKQLPNEFTTILLEVSIDGGHSFMTIGSASPSEVTKTIASNILHEAANGQAIKYRITHSGGKCDRLHSNIIDSIWETKISIEHISTNESCPHTTKVYRLRGNSIYTFDVVSLNENGDVIENQTPPMSFKVLSGDATFKIKSLYSESESKEFSIGLFTLKPYKIVLSGEAMVEFKITSPTTVTEIVGGYRNIQLNCTRQKGDYEVPRVTSAYARVDIEGNQFDISNSSPKYGDFSVQFP